MIWVVNWPSSGTIADFASNVTEYVLAKLRYSNVYLVFDKYNDYSIKSAARAERGKAASKSHQLTKQTPLPSKQVVLGNNSNKSQLIDIIFDDVIQHAQEKKHS